MIAFNASRGFASGAWLPWISEIVPAAVRSRYLGIENAVINLGSLVSTLAFGALILCRGHSQVEGWMFAVMVTAAALFAAVSLMAVSKAPGGAPQPGDGQADEPGMNWGRFRAAWEIPEFRRVVRFAVWQTLSLGALGGFAINYAKEYLGTAGDGMVLLFSAGNLAAAMAAGWIAGRWLDRTGSRPVLRCSCWAFVAIALAWLACALGKARFGHGEMAILFAAQGMAGTFLGIAQVRLLIATCPAPLKTEGLSLYQVLCSLAGGLSPLAWGFILHTLPGGLGARYAVFFFVVAAMMLLGHFLINGIRESAAMHTREMLGLLILDTPRQMAADIVDLAWRPFAGEAAPKQERTGDPDP